VVAIITTLNKAFQVAALTRIGLDILDVHVSIAAAGKEFVTAR
jgi:hypothetical protein